jgi:CRP-like cAMP-binding protein
MALLGSAPRHGTCVALVPTRLVAIKSGELLLKLRRDPTFALEMLQQMSRRISYLEQEITKLMEDELASRQELSRILGKAEYSRRDT